MCELRVSSVDGPVRSQPISAVREIRFYRATGRFRFLSNLFRCPVFFENREFSCSEAAYQFGKPRDPAVAEWMISAPRAHLISIVAHGLFRFDVRSGWNAIKVPRVRDVLRAKFQQNPDLAARLRESGDAVLVEQSNMDAFWGL